LARAGFPELGFHRTAHVDEAPRSELPDRPVWIRWRARGSGERGARAMKILGKLSELARDDRAQTTVEYALLTGIVAVAAISALERIRQQLLDVFFIVNGALSNAPVGDAG
jgi:Flp pilus assembly pilin Flp